MPMASAVPLVACYPELIALPAGTNWPRTLDLGGKLPELTTGTVIGITVAITGNVLISLALNLQKLAHKRMEAEKLNRRRAQPTTNGAARPDDTIPEAGEYSASPEPVAEAALLVTQHSDYGSMSSSSSNASLHEMSAPPKKTLLSRLFRPKQHPPANGIASERTTLLPVDVITEEDILAARRRPKHKTSSLSEVLEEEGNESDYLKSKLWWLGFALMNVGELGNFISYAWAPASVVAPLGTFALVANCIFAPLMLSERFRKRDIVGIMIAVVGAVTVVLASNASDTRLDPDALLLAISQPSFIAYSAVYLVGIIVLSILSQGPAGRQWVFVDVGLCALFGGFTVLSTKAVSTLLTMQWFEMFTKWITYPTIAVLALTGVGQIRYLNRALMRFDAKVVIPIQFVLFTMSAIVGSAVLYGDFKKATFHQLVTFLYGCAATFTGVFIIAWEPQRDAPEDETEPATEDHTPSPDAAGSGDETLEGTIGRRKRPTLVLPSGFREHQLLHQPSAVSMLALSPARPLLMVHTPPREVPDRFRAGDAERGDPHPPLSGSQRRRAMSYMGDDVRPRTSRNGGALHGSVGRFSLANGFSPASAGLSRSDESTSTTTNFASSTEDGR